MKKIDSVCAYCGVGCDIEASIKGKYGFDFAHSPNRLSAVKIKKSFIDKNILFLPTTLREALGLYEVDEKGYIYPSLELAYRLTAWKIKTITSQHGNFSYASIGGARGNCESSYLLQKFTRKVIKSPHIDNCARVCHAPTLKGMRSIIGEGAATNPFSDIKNCEFMIVIGSNTTQAHPIVANKIIRAKQKGAGLAVFDVRDIALSKFADFNCVIPYESNLLILNMLKKVARSYATKKSLILWGPGITEHLDGSYAAAAICHLAVLTGNIGKSGAGLMPLRGQNNVQGTCDMGCLPYYNPDYEHPLVEGKKHLI